jgi:hypothetical protein
MPSSNLGRGFAATLTAILLAAAAAIGAVAIPVRPAPEAPPKVRNWPKFGGTPQRNLVNPFAKNLPTDWSVDPEKGKNIKWVADLGCKASAAPSSPTAESSFLCEAAKGVRRIRGGKRVGGLIAPESLRRWDRQAID